MADESDGTGPKLPRATPRAVIAPALLDQAVAALERKVAAAPENAASWRSLGNLHRRRGDFPAALAAYRRLQALQNDATASWLVAVASGEEPPKTPPKGIRPAPFLHVTNFFTPAQQERLLAVTRLGPESFMPATIFHGAESKVTPHVRTALVARRRATREVRRWFAPKLRRLLPRVAAHLQIGQIGKRLIETQITAHPTGGLYRAHYDLGNPVSNRLISYVCYFHEEPRRFSGGELLLYDTCPEPQDANLTSFSRIDPVGNSAIFFPSYCCHEVLAVDCQSDALQDGRFAVNGWVRDRTLPSEVPPRSPEDGRDAERGGSANEGREEGH